MNYNIKQQFYLDCIEQYGPQAFILNPILLEGAPLFGEAPEVWKDVVGFEGLYSVSNTGKVYSKPCVYYTPKGRRFTKTGKDMKLVLSSDNYQHVTLFKGIVRGYYQSVHRLVALAFIANPENKPEVNHKDGNKQNNNLWNLEWNTRQENISHSLENGLRNVNVANNRHFKKLNVNDIVAIRQLFANGVSKQKISEMYFVSRANIHSIIERKTWYYVA